MDDATLQNCVFFTENNSTELFFNGTSQGFMIMRRIFFLPTCYTWEPPTYTMEIPAFITTMAASTGNDVYSGDRFCGNDGFSGPKPPDHAILFTVSGITAIADKKILKFSKLFVCYIGDSANSK